MVELSFDNFSNDYGDERSSTERSSEEEAKLADDMTQGSEVSSIIQEILAFSDDDQNKVMHKDKLQRYFPSSTIELVTYQIISNCLNMVLFPTSVVSRGEQHCKKILQEFIVSDNGSIRLLWK